MLWCVVSCVLTNLVCPSQPTFGGADKINAVSGHISGPSGEIAKVDGHWDNIINITMGGKKVASRCPYPSPRLPIALPTPQASSTSTLYVHLTFPWAGRAD